MAKIAQQQLDTKKHAKIVVLEKILPVFALDPRCIAVHRRSFTTI